MQMRREQLTRVSRINNHIGRVFVLGAMLHVFILGAVAQQPGPRSTSPTTMRGQINDDTFRELTRVERESVGSAPRSEGQRKALLKQLREDFKGVQDTNNKMMAQAWSRESLDYQELAKMISQINERATRLKTNLYLPPDAEKKKNGLLTVSNLKEFRAALLLMDRFIMGFVKNSIFQKPDVVEINSAAQAANDLENVIALSSNLKKIALSLSSSGASKQ
jgi:hypothetical protein